MVRRGISPNGVNKDIGWVSPPPSSSRAQNHKGPFPDALKSPRSFSLYLRADRWKGERGLLAPEPPRCYLGKRNPLLTRGDAVGRTAVHSPICLRRVLGSLRPTGFGGARFTTSLPGSRKSGLGSTLCLTRGGGGGRAPRHPIPRGQAGRGRGPDSWGGRVGLQEPFQHPHSGGPPLLPRQPPRRSPHLFPRQLRVAGARAGGRVSRLRRVRASQPAPAGTKCAGLGPAPPGARRVSGGQFANTK